MPWFATAEFLNLNILIIFDPVFGFGRIPVVGRVLFFAV